MHDDMADFDKLPKHLRELLTQTTLPPIEIEYMDHYVAKVYLENRIDEEHLFEEWKAGFRLTRL